MIIKPLKKQSSKGTSAIITIPKIILRSANCEIGDNFSISCKGNKIILEKVGVVP